MKKNLLLLVILSTCFYHTTHAQENRIKPFQKLGVGLEIGPLPGLGLEISTSLHAQVNVRAGFSMLPYTYRDNFTLEYEASTIEMLRTQYASELASYGVNIDNLVLDQVRLKAKTGLYNGKLLVDFHPSPNSSFHITAGLYFGKQRILTADGSLPDETWKTLNEVNEVIGNNPAWGLQPVETSIEFGDYIIHPDANGHLDAGIKINTVKPYLGIGFGRAIPKRSWGFSFDLGAMYHGTPSIVSKDPGVAASLNDEINKNKDITKWLKKAQFLPVLSMKVTKRIF